jgi:hypothetical protein
MSKLVPAIDTRGCFHFEIPDLSEGLVERANFIADVFKGVHNRNLLLR